MNGLDTSCAISIAMVAPEAQSGGTVRTHSPGAGDGRGRPEGRVRPASSAKKTLTRTSEFKNIKAQDSGYDGAMGSGDITGAMGSFSGNWDYHRNKLAGSMQPSAR